MSKLSRLKWWILHRFHPKHKYNVIKLKLEPGYYDWDVRIIHATFELFSEWMECNECEYPEGFDEIESWWIRVRDDDDFWFKVGFEDNEEYKEFIDHYKFLVDNIFHLWT
jgi:hypothetical protein